MLRNQLHIHCYYLAVTIYLTTGYGCLCVYVHALSMCVCLCARMCIYLDVYIKYKGFLVYLFGRRIEVVLDNKERISIICISDNFFDL